MQSLIDYIITEHTDSLGNELSVGEVVMFRTTGHLVFGQIESITDGDKPKCKIKTLGWSHKDPEFKAKDYYNINVSSKDLTGVTLKGKIEDIFK